MTTGADVVVGLLRSDDPVLAVVPVERIKLGRLPADVPLPALLVRTVSSVDHQFLDQGPVRRTTDRVAVTARASSYREMAAIIRFARTALGGRTGDFGDALRASVLTGAGGPDLDGPNDSFEQTQDFRVSFDTAA